MSLKNFLIAIVVVSALIVIVGILYERIVPGLSSARTDQSQVETAIATWLTTFSPARSVGRYARNVETIFRA